MPVKYRPNRFAPPLPCAVGRLRPARRCAGQPPRCAFTPPLCSTDDWKAFYYWGEEARRKPRKLSR